MSREKQTMAVIMMGILFSLSVMVSAAPMGTVFTYQGRLTDAGSPADSRYDFKFSLYDALTGGSQAGSTLTKTVQVNDGYFKVELDFGNYFRGDALWLEIEVSPYKLGTFTPLSPRQELTPTPYAIYATAADSVIGGIGIDGSGTADYIPKFLDHNTLEDSVISQDGGNIGIGAAPTSARLFVDGDIMLDYSDAYKISMYSGLGWNSSTGSITLGAPNSSVGLELYSGSTDPRMIIDKSTGNVGIANPTPDAKLHVLSSTFDAAVLGENGGNSGYLGHNSVGVKGDSVDGVGVRGFSENDWAVLGVSPNGSGQAGVVGAIITDNAGMLWWPNSGVSGGTQDGYGVSGRSISGIGVFGAQVDSGNYGYIGTDTAGVYGEAPHAGSYGVHGINTTTASADTPGVYGQHDAVDFYGIGVQGRGGWKGVEGAVAPTGSESYYGVRGTVSGGSGTNYGVYGYAAGGATNYAGYFSGPLKVSTTSGDNAVQLPSSSISASEILNEPGITRGRNNSSVTISTTGVTNITSSTITVPAAGYIVARAHAIGRIYGTTIGSIAVGIETAVTTSPTIGERTTFGASDESVGAVSKYRWGSLAPERVFYVSSAGSYTYYLNAYRAWTGGTGTVWYSKLVLTYIPTSYGTVAATASAAESAQFENVSVETVLSDNAADGEAAEKTVYTVDLRELELRAAKARAEAERAEKELLEARMKEKDREQN
jgi:hypothetical protein